MKICILIFLSIITNQVHAAETAYKPDCFIKPCEIRGDFDGDKKSDRAFLVKDNENRKGIQVNFANGKSKVIGAGIEIGNGGNDFSWMDKWSLHKGKIEQGAAEMAPPKYKGDALHIEKTMAASAIIYWEKSGFQWYQQGD